MSEASYLGSGNVYLREKGSGDPFLPVGNCSALNFAFEEDKKTLTDYRNPGGGIADSVTRITGATGNMTTHTLSARNLAKALRADVSAVVGAAIVDEAHTSAGVEGEFIPFDHPRDSSQPLTVKDSADTALTEDVDYTVSAGGIVVIGGGGIDDQGVKLSYQSAGADVVEMLTNSGKEYVMLFEGLNEANSGKAVKIVIHRVKFSPASGMDWLGDDFAELPLSFDMLADNSITAAGKSKYAKVSFEQ